MNPYSMTHAHEEVRKVQRSLAPGHSADHGCARRRRARVEGREITLGSAGYRHCSDPTDMRRFLRPIFTLEELQAVRAHYELRIRDEEQRRVQLETQLKLALARLKE